MAALLCRPAMRWALAGRPTAPKVLCLRRIVLPGMAARAEPVAHEVAPGIVFRGNSGDFVPMVVGVFGRWEPAMTRFLRDRLTPGRVFVDVGANIGWFVLVAAPLVGDTGAVVAVEASPAIHARLAAQIRENGLTNVRTVNEAAGAQDSWVTIVDGPAWNSAQSAVTAGGPQPGAVRCRPVDAMLRTDEIARIRVVKIDVEGAEYEVVRGLDPLLDALPDDAEIVVEVGPGRTRSTERVPELWATFARRGYTGYELPNEYTAAFLRDPVVPAALRRLDSPPSRQVDVVFSRVAAPELAI